MTGVWWPTGRRSNSMDENVAGAQQIKVFLLDDHEIVRRGVKDLLEAESDITVIGEAGTAASALARIPALRPDVAVLDVRLPDGDGVVPGVARPSAPPPHFLGEQNSPQACEAAYR